MQRLSTVLPQLEEAAAAWQSPGPSAERDAGRLRQDLEVRHAGLVERRRMLADRAAEVERRLAGHADERATAASPAPAPGGRGRDPDPPRGRGRRRARPPRDASSAPSRSDYQDQVDAVRAGGERLEQLRQDRHTTDQRLEAVRTRTRALDLETNEVVAAPRSPARAHRAATSGVTPDEVVGLAVPDVPEDTTHQHHAAELERKLVGARPGQPAGPRGALRRWRSGTRTSRCRWTTCAAPAGSSTR